MFITTLNYRPGSTSVSTPYRETVHMFKVIVSVTARLARYNLAIIEEVNN